MNTRGYDPLLLAGKIVTIIMQAAVGFGAAVVALVLPAVALFKEDIVKGMAETSKIPVQDLPMAPLIGLLAIVLLFLAAMFVFFGKLRAIIATVGEGDPFVPANADRLSLMAWLMLGVQALSWPLATLAMTVAEWAQRHSDGDLSIGSGGDVFSLSGILMVLVLFILARVFRQGAAMREDLEGTV
ncbi:MAG: DUF2975 domain-containing protein [Bosea sp. (in: a-proteobacteria)]